MAGARLWSGLASSPLAGGASSAPPAPSVTSVKVSSAPTGSQPPVPPAHGAGLGDALALDHPALDRPEPAGAAADGVAGEQRAVPPQRLLAGVAGDALGRAVPVGDAPREIGGEEAVRQGIGEQVHRALAAEAEERDDGVGGWRGAGHVPPC
jgi:hypothetical protein